MPEETPRYCETCNKSEIRTGKSCPTRSGCFTPDYKNWEPVVEGDKNSPGWRINYITFDNENSHVTVSLSSLSAGTIMVELSPDEIADFSVNH